VVIKKWTSLKINLGNLLINLWIIFLNKLIQIKMVRWSIANFY